MAKDLKVGERIRAYDSAAINYGVDPWTGVVVEVTGPQIRIETDWGTMKWVHSKQCRRLKPKVKKVAREVWLHPSPWDKGRWTQSGENGYGAVLFREVLK